jgi:hypothetical protein
MRGSWVLLITLALLCFGVVQSSEYQRPILGGWDAHAAPAKNPKASSKADVKPETMRLAQNDADLSSTGNPSTAPLKWSGLLLNKDIVSSDGKKYEGRCTAQFISASVLLTAAHCVQDYKTGSWFDIGKMYFLLQYQNLDFSRAYRPLCLSRFDGWFPKSGEALQGRSQWDYAMILVEGQSLTGHFNWEVNWVGKYQHATMTGYPNALLKGQIVQHAQGTLAPVSGRQNLVSLLRPDHPSLREGTSGGAWVVNFDKSEEAGYNVVIGVTSYYELSSPGVMFGPYLTSDYRNLFDHVSKRCPTPPATGLSSAPSVQMVSLGSQKATSVTRAMTRDLGLGRAQLLKAAGDSVTMTPVP